MDTHESPVEKLNDSLNSRNYKPEEDIRTPVRPQESDEDSASWHDPSLDEMLKERRVAPPHPSLMRKIFIGSICFFVLAVLAAVWIFYGGSNFISSKNVDIAVVGPVSVSAGDPVTLAITVSNKNNADLTSADLSITYPDGTRTASDTSQTLLRDKASFGLIAAGQSATKSVSASFFGETGSIKEVTFEVDYKVRGSNATFSKEKTYDIALGNAPVSIGVTKPDTIVSGEPFTTVVTVDASSPGVVKGVVLKADYPYGFKATGADPAATNGDNFWALGDLSPGDKKTVSITGVLSGVNEDSRTFRFEAGVADASNRLVLKDAIAGVSDTIALTRPALGVSIALNGSSDANYVAPAGGNVNAVVHVTNNSPSKLGNAKIIAKLSGAYDSNTVSVLGGGFYDSNSNTISWNSDAVPDLQSLDPGESVDVSFSFASLQAARGSKEADIGASVSGIPLGSGSDGALSSSAVASVKIASEVAFQAHSIYSRGPFANSGPVPPKVGSQTTYSIYFDLGNTENDVASSTVTAKLGPNVEWMSSQTSAAENVSYDAGNNTVTWNVGTLVSGAGYSGPAREAIFEVGLTPSLAQAGNSATLLSSVVFSGTDSFTNTPLTISAQNVTTAITSDPSYIQGDETVVK